LATAVAIIGTAAEELPPGIPRTVMPDGRIILDVRFTSDAYRAEGLKLMILEVNRVARDLKTEQVPISSADLVEVFVAPFGFSYIWNSIGTVSTAHYSYSFAGGNKFSFLTIARYNQVCFDIQEHYQVPLRVMDTNAAYQLAAQWLNAASMDVQGLAMDCRLEVTANEFWNGLELGEKPKRPKFVPIYDVCWMSRTNLTGTGPGTAAMVELFAPTKKLLQLRVEDPKYILRRPLVFSNLAGLFPERATIITNQAVKLKEVDVR
jgi:hypothetical protein